MSANSFSMFKRNVTDRIGKRERERWLGKERQSNREREKKKKF